jgi:hypothetical protein
VFTRALHTQAHGFYYWIIKLILPRHDFSNTQFVRLAVYVRKLDCSTPITCEINETNKEKENIYSSVIDTADVL